MNRALDKGPSSSLCLTACMRELARGLAEASHPLELEGAVGGWKREREREREGGREGGRKKERQGGREGAGERERKREGGE